MSTHISFQVTLFSGPSLAVYGNRWEMIGKLYGTDNSLIWKVSDQDYEHLTVRPWLDLRWQVDRKPMIKQDENFLLWDNVG